MREAGIEEVEGGAGRGMEEKLKGEDKK